MKDVAKLADVSTMSVSRAFRNTSQVTAETRERIHAAATQLGYVPNLTAANLSSGRSRMIVAIVPSIRNSNFSTMLQGLGDGLAAADFHLMLAVAPTIQAELAAVRDLLGRRPDGIVLTEANATISRPVSMLRDPPGRDRRDLGQQPPVP